MASVSILGDDSTADIDILNDSSISTGSSSTASNESGILQSDDESVQPSVHNESDVDGIMNGNDRLRYYLYLIVEHRLFNVTLIFLILLNTVFIGIYISVDGRSEWYLILLEGVFLLIYLVELAIRTYVWKHKFFLHGWNIFDLVLIVAYVIDYLLLLIAHTTNHSILLQTSGIIAAFRGVRMLRIIRFLKKLRVFLLTILKSVPAMAPIVILIFLVLYIFAVIGRELYGEVAPDRFGNLAKASFTLFQLITLDDWFFIYSDIRDHHPDHQHILVYLVLFIVLETFIFINLFVGVIVDSLSHMQTVSNKKSLSMHHHHMNKIHHDKDSEVDLIQGGVHDHTSMREELQLRKIENEYRHGNKHTVNEVHLLTRYWHTMGLLEHQFEINNKRQCTVNELVDLVDK